MEIWVSKEMVAVRSSLGRKQVYEKSGWQVFAKAIYSETVIIKKVAAN